MRFGGSSGGGRGTWCVVAKRLGRLFPTSSQTNNPLYSYAMTPEPVPHLLPSADPVVPALPMVGNRYVIGQLLGKGGMGEVWKVFDRHTSQHVALKRIRPVRLRSTGMAIEESSRLTQEFQLMAGLYHPNVIGVLDFGLDRQGWPFYTMRLLNNCNNIVLASRQLDRGGKVRLIIQLFEGLAYLHRRGILHRDLKPGNVQVHNGQVHIVDFGLSITTAHTNHIDVLAGTPQYLAPELLDGIWPSEQSDVYAAGLIAYEIVTESSLFQTSDRTTLENAIRTAAPVGNHPQLQDDLGRLLKQLLAKNPHERPHDHRAIIAQLYEIAGIVVNTTVLDQAPEGVSRTAPMVGRERELEELIQDLSGASDGNGRSRLVMGMVGAGKSRLVDELRSAAMVRGFFVVGGRCQAEIGVPYAPWRQVLRLLVIEQGVSDHEAAILKPLIPDIDSVTGRPTPLIPATDPSGNQARLAALMIQLIRNFKRGVLIVLEDLHWAGHESLELFAALTSHACELPLLLLGTARSEEVPKLPSLLGISAITMLRPLTAVALQELVEGTIGPAGRSRALNELVARESEGNPFFAVEVLRAVIARAGGWDKIESVPLPERLIIGGMRAVVSRRLHRLRIDDRYLVESAALAGRDLDLTFLSALEPKADWLAFLQRSAEHGLVENRAGSWCFVHDQLRQTLVEGIEAGRRRDLHRRIAGILVTRGDNAVAAGLAHHWRQADEPGEETRWAAQAGEQALTAGAYQQATVHFQRVIDLQRRFPGDCPKELDLQTVYYLAGVAAFCAGNFAASRQHLQGLLAIIDRPMPSGSFQRTVGMCGQVVIQVIHRLSGGCGSWLPANPRYKNWRQQCARTWELLSRLHIYEGDGLGVLLCALRASNLSEIDRQPLIYAHGILGCAAASAQQWRLAEGYFTRCQSHALAGGHSADLVDALVMEASAHLGAAHFGIALERLRRARRIASEIGYLLGQGQALTIEGMCHGYAGDLSRMLEVNREALECIRHHSHGHQPGFRCGQALALTFLGRFTEARATLEQARRQSTTDDRLIRSLICAGLLLVHLREGDLSAAEEETVRLREQLEGLTVIPSPCAQLLEAPAELLIAQWHLAQQEGRPQNTFHERAKICHRGLVRWARLNQLAIPIVAWFRGHQLLLTGNLSGACATWDTGRQEAGRLGMPLYEASLCLALALHGPRKRQREHAQRARSLALASNAMWHLRQMEQVPTSEDSGSAYDAWLADDGAATQTAAYHVPTARIERP